MLVKIKIVLMLVLVVCLGVLGYSVYTMDFVLKEVVSEVIIYVVIAIVYIKATLNSEKIKELISRRGYETKNKVN